MRVSQLKRFVPATVRGGIYPVLLAAFRVSIVLLLLVLRFILLLTMLVQGIGRLKTFFTNHRSEKGRTTDSQTRDGG